MPSRKPKFKTSAVIIDFGGTLAVKEVEDNDNRIQEVEGYVLDKVKYVFHIRDITIRDNAYAVL